MTQKTSRLPLFIGGIFGILSGIVIVIKRDYIAQVMSSFSTTGSDWVFICGMALIILGILSFVTAVTLKKR